MRLNTEQRQKIQHRLETKNLTFQPGDGWTYVGGPVDDVIEAVAEVLMAGYDD
jgi:hypothetical protein